MKVLAAAVLAAALSGTACACTGFCASVRGVTLVGNNEDYNNPRTKLWFVPAGRGAYGRMYVGFDNFFPQGGMNDQGLFFDGFATERVAAAPGRESYSGNLADKAMAECATVAEVVRLFEKYDRSFLERGILLFADRNGDATAIEPNAVVRKTGRYFIQTNFHQSRVKAEAVTCDRFKIAGGMLDRAGENISVELFRRILAATHAEGQYPTLYSNVYDLNQRVMYLYHFHNYENVVRIDLREKLKQGKQVYDLPALFPKTFAAEVFARGRQ